MTASIQFGSKQINFKVEYSERKTLGISVMPDQAILVKAPKETPLNKIQEKIRKKAPGLLNSKAFSFPFIQRHRLASLLEAKPIYIWAGNTA
jgi:predicted metal-dependent hydrolase